MKTITFHIEDCDKALLKKFAIGQKLTLSSFCRVLILSTVKQNRPILIDNLFQDIILDSKKDVEAQLETNAISNS